MKGHSHFVRVRGTANILSKAGSSLGVWCALAITLLMPCAAHSQDTGYISGTVIDKSGAAVAGADVVLTNTAGSLTRSTTTNSDGAYVVAGLPGDTYNLTVLAKGFQKYTAQNVKLDVAEKARIDVTLTVGAMSEEITVTGDSVAQVETESSAIGTTITGKQVNQLELNGRNFTQLVTLAPGVVNQTGTDDGKVGVYGNVSYSMNGGRTEYNNWELDGGDNMDNGSNGTLNVYPNLEAIAEFKVLTSNYGAQYGRNGSGTIEVETKSGTNSFHGSAFEYLRNEAFKARSWSEGACVTCAKAPYKKHDFGYTVGGPVFIPNHYNSNKKKTFFFWSQEWRREKNPNSIFQQVPSGAERAGNFSDLCSPTPGVIDKVNFPDCPVNPATSTRFAQDTVTPTSVGGALVTLIPTANATSNGFPAVSSTISTPTTWREELIRIDHNLTDNHRLTFRYIHDSWSTVVPNALWGNGTESFNNITTNFVGPGTSFVARLNSNINPTLLNEFVASYTADHIFLNALGPVGLPSGFAMGSIFSNGFGGKIPAITLSSNAAYGGGTWGNDSGYFPWNNANPTYTYRDNVTKTMGRHIFQFGVYTAFAQKNEMNSPNVQGILTFSTSSSVSTGNAFADLLQGNITSYSQWSAERKYYNRYKIVEPYFQDDWRVNNHLTLNLGVRFSFYGTYRERYKQAFNFNPDTWNAANAPGFQPDGSLSTGTGTGNPLNGVVQCGGAGGTFPLIPGSAFPTVNVGSSSNAGCLKGHVFNPAPRIGFAWDPRGNGKMAIRGGYGIFYEHTNGNEANTESLEGSAPLVMRATQSNIAGGVGSCGASAGGGYTCIGSGAGLVPVFPLSLTTVPNKAIWPYMQQWNLSIQKELPSHVILSAAYVGSKGTHLTVVNNANQIFATPASANPYAAGEPIVTGGGPFDPSPGVVDPNNTGKPVNTVCPDPANLTGGSVNGHPVSGQVARNLAVACGAGVDALRTRFPGDSNITSLRDEANSIYHSLQVGATRSVGDLTLSVAYSYGHSIDDSSDRSDNTILNAFNVAANRASSNFDQRQNLSISYIYALPFFRGSGLTHNVLGGWQVSGITVAQSGQPFTVTNGLASFADNAGVGNGVATAASHPDFVSDPRAGFTPNQDPSVRGPLFYNPNAFRAPTGLTFGNVGRNTLTLPGRLNFDFGLFKRFAINERTGFEFRAETFNLFNHTQFGTCASGGGCSNPINAAFLPGSNFMHLSSAHDPRRMQLGLRFYF